MFGSLKSTDIFISSMKFSLNYEKNFIYAFFKKKRSNIYLNKKLKKRNIQKSFKLFFSKTKYFVYVRLFFNARFSRKFSVTIDMVWITCKTGKTSLDNPYFGGLLHSLKTFFRRQKEILVAYFSVQWYVSE